MGLGKTVEVIACILCHRKPSSEHKVLDNTMAADQDSNVNSKPNTAPSVTKLNVQERSKMQPTECDCCYQEGTDRNADKPDSSCDKINSDPTDISCNQGSSCSKTTLTLCDDNSNSDTVAVTGDDTGSVCMPIHSTMSCNQSENFVTELQRADEQTTSNTSVVKCQCICGINIASSDDKLLECCICQAVFHAECLQYDCPGKFLCPHCAVNQVRGHSSGSLVEQKLKPAH